VTLWRQSRAECGSLRWSTGNSVRTRGLWS
jgi:hypothetical protein